MQHSMQPLTLQEVQQAFTQKKRKRFLLVYLYFESHFHAGLPADLVAQKLTEALAIPITRNQVFEIHRRYRSKKTSLPPSPLPGNAASVRPAENTKSSVPDVLIPKTTFVNTDDEGRTNPYEKLLRDL
jgi:hypothetical protein